MIESKNYKIATYKDGEFVKFGYPHRFLNVEISGLNPSVKFYLVEEVAPDTFNTEQFYKTALPLEVSEELSEFDNVYKAFQKYELTEFSQAAIIQKVTSNCEDFINETLPLSAQTANISRFLYLQIMQNMEYTEDRAVEMAFLNTLDNWVIACRALRDEMINDYTNSGIFPTFNQWPMMPVNE